MTLRIDILWNVCSVQAVLMLTHPNEAKRPFIGPYMCP